MASRTLTTGPRGRIEAMIPAGPPTAFAPFVYDYVGRYLRRSFHTVHLFGEPPQFDDDGRTPLLVCLNHSSWWDVLFAFYFEREFFGWERYGVMDERQLQRYRLFSKLGMIGVDRTSLQGAREFLDYAERLLQGRRRALLLTPQGAMLSNEARPLVFQPGLAHLAQRLGSFHVVRIALHYEFWDDKLPEAFVAVSPIESYTAGSSFSRRDFLHAQERQMEMELDTLLTLVRLRDPAAFTPLLHGKTGISPTYDLLRSLSARLRGRDFSSEHSAVTTPKWKKRDSP